MSDESQPPPLRLKPRLRVGNEPAAAMPAAAAGDKPDRIASPEPRVRLKPRLSVDPELAQPATLSDEIAALPAAVAAMPDEPPSLSLPPIGTKPSEGKLPVVEPVPPSLLAVPTAEAAAKFKLKPKAPIPVPPGIIAPAVPATGSVEIPLAAVAIPPSPPVAEPAPVDVPPPRVEAPPPAKFSGAPHVPHIRGPGEEMPLPKAPLPPVPLKRRHISKPILIIVVLAGAGIVACAGYFAWSAFSPSLLPPPVSKVATKPDLPPAGPGAKTATPQALKDAVTPTPASATPATPGPTPSATLNQIVAVPQQAIDKAKDVVTARRNNEQARIDAMSAGEEAPDQRALDTPPPSRFSNHSAPSDVAAAPAPVPGTGTLIAPGVTATSNDVTAAPRASAAFKRFVADARITGVFQGTPPRALINGRTVRAGEVVDLALGVVFDSIDSEAKTITFKDRAGNPATRKY